MYYTGEFDNLQWIVLGVTVPLSVVITATVTALIVWCCLTRKKLSQIPLTEGNTQHVTNDQLHRRSEHIYSNEIFNRDSLLQNFAYQHNISLSCNPAYEASLKRERKLQNTATV